MLVGRVVDDELDHHLKIAIMSGTQERFEIVHGPVTGMDIHVIGDVITVVAQRGREEGQQPNAGDSQRLQVIQLLVQALKISDAIVVAVREGLDVQLINDGVFKP
jgi:hypothetical protein